MKDTTFESFALVELFGHTRIAGKVTEQTVGSATFIREVVEKERVRLGMPAENEEDHY